MNKKIILGISLLFVLLFVGIGKASITSYGSITGYATLEPAITWDIIKTGSDINETDDIVYSLEKTYQGEIKWVKVKIKNSGDEPVNMNLLFNSSSPDVTASTYDETKENPISSTSVDSTTYVWLRHEFSDSASPGNYTFQLSLLPIE
jgi:hypothetical protein